MAKAFKTVSVREMSVPVWKVAVSAAKKAGQPIGAWLETVIRMHTGLSPATSLDFEQMGAILEGIAREQAKDPAVKAVEAVRRAAVRNEAQVQVARSKSAHPQEPQGAMCVNSRCLHSRREHWRGKQVACGVGGCHCAGFQI